MRELEFLDRFIDLSLSDDFSVSQPTAKVSGGPNPLVLGARGGH